MTAEESDALGIGCFVVGVIGAVLAISGVFVWLTNSLTVSGDMAQIERLRIDAAIIDPLQAEDVIGQVTQWNQTIVSNQNYDRMPVIGWFVPDEWSRVEIIEVPKAPS
jgi:hypothetical protein